MPLRCYYLHGFASSPGSGKARFYAEHLAELGVACIAPDFNLPDFSTLTVTRMLAQLDAAIESAPPGPVVLIGSSLGGFVALHAANRRRTGPPERPITGLILLAPALDFGSDRVEDPVIDEWRRLGTREVFHHGYGRPMRIGAALWEDAARFDSATIRVEVPILVFQGLRDEVVPPAAAIAFAEARPNVRLRLLDDGHQLKGHLPDMWEESAAFLGLGTA